MVRPRKVTVQQLHHLLKYMEQHKDLAKNRQMNSPQGHARAVRLWQHLATGLNNIDNGVHKNYKEWRNYWNEVKYRAKKKASQLRAHARNTGGGPSNGQLTDFETRVLDILETVPVEGNPSVPLPVPLLQEQLKADPEGGRDEELQYQAAFFPGLALEMERSRMEDERRHTAAVESIANSLLVIQQQLARLIDHLINIQ